MNHSWAFPPSWVKGGVREGTRYRGLTTWSLLHWLWLQMTSNAQDGIFRYFGFISVQWVEVKWNGLSILMSVNGSHQQAHKGNRDKPTSNSTHAHTHTHTHTHPESMINVCFQYKYWPNKCLFCYSWDQNTSRLRYTYILLYVRTLTYITLQVLLADLHSSPKHTNKLQFRAQCLAQIHFGMFAGGARDQITNDMQCYAASTSAVCD